MHRYEARISWQRGDEVFSDNKYSRGHDWYFDGGITVPASSSPQVVRLPFSVEAAVDPEEALIASASSCHMLSFLYIAAKQGFVIDRYEDEAYGILDRIERGKMAMTKIVLRPKVAFSGAKTPDPAQLAEMHHTAHDECYIANSLKTEVVVEEAT